MPNELLRFPIPRTVSRTFRTVPLDQYDEQYCDDRVRALTTKCVAPMVGEQPDTTFRRGAPVHKRTLAARNTRRPYSSTPTPDTTSGREASTQTRTGLRTDTALDHQGKESRKSRSLTRGHFGRAQRRSCVDAPIRDFNSSTCPSCGNDRCANV